MHTLISILFGLGAMLLVSCGATNEVAVPEMETQEPAVEAPAETSVATE